MRLLFACLLLLPFAARGADMVDAAGRHVTLPDTIRRVLPAGPPAAVLLEALAPDLMIGWPHPLSPEAASWLPDAAARLPAAPAADPDNPAIKAAAPDLILDYGNVNPCYVERAGQIQAATGIPTLLLDGSLAETPAVLRRLGTALGRAARGEELAGIATAILAARPDQQPHSVVYGRGADGLDVAVPGSLATQVFAILHWRVLAPPGERIHRRATLAEIKALDPDVLILEAAAMRQTITGSPDRQSLRAVREHHAFVAPGLPFGWIAEPPSLNRLLGVAWLGGADPVAAMQSFGSKVYGRAPTAAELAALRETLRPVEP